MVLDKSSFFSWVGGGKWFLNRSSFEISFFRGNVLFRESSSREKTFFPYLKKVVEMIRPMNDPHGFCR